MFYYCNTDSEEMQDKKKQSEKKSDCFYRILRNP